MACHGVAPSNFALFHSGANLVRNWPDPEVGPLSQAATIPSEHCDRSCAGLVPLVARNRYRWLGRCDACILPNSKSFAANREPPRDCGTMAPGAGCLRAA